MFFFIFMFFSNLFMFSKIFFNVFVLFDVVFFVLVKTKLQNMIYFPWGNCI